MSESSSIYLAWDCSLTDQLMDGQWIKWSISVLRGCRVCLCLCIFCAAAAPPPPMMMGFWLRQSAMLNTCYYCHGLSIQLIITPPPATHALVHWTIFSFPHKYFKQMFFVEVLMRIYLPWHQKLINFFLNIYHFHNINYCVPSPADNQFSSGESSWLTTFPSHRLLCHLVDFSIFCCHPAQLCGPPYQCLIMGKRWVEWDNHCHLIVRILINGNLSQYCPSSPQHCGCGWQIVLTQCPL